MSSLGNWGPSRKGYKMRCLQLPFFWFMSSAKGIKWKREKKKRFCFDIQLEPNPRIWQTTRLHGAGCNSTELHGICMSKVPQVLLGKRVTTNSLSKNLVFQFSGKRRVTHYLWVTKKEKQTWPMASTINQTNKVLLQAKRIHICGVHLGHLPQTSLGGSCL